MKEQTLFTFPLQFRLLDYKQDIYRCKHILTSNNILNFRIELILIIESTIFISYLQQNHETIQQSPTKN